MERYLYTCCCNGYQYWKCEGEEVVQLYVRDEVASITRPIKELKGFEKIKLSPGESKTVTFDVKMNN